MGSPPPKKSKTPTQRVHHTSVPPIWSPTSWVFIYIYIYISPKLRGHPNDNDAALGPCRPGFRTLRGEHRLNLASAGDVLFDSWFSCLFAYFSVLQRGCIFGLTIFVLSSISCVDSGRWFFQGVASPLAQTLLCQTAVPQRNSSEWALGSDFFEARYLFFGWFQRDTKDYIFFLGGPPNKDIPNKEA